MEVTSLLSPGASLLSHPADETPHLAAASTASGHSENIAPTTVVPLRSHTAKVDSAHTPGSIVNIQDLRQDLQLRTYLRDFICEYEALTRADLLKKF